MTAPEGRRLRIGLLVTLCATALRLAWALAVPTIPVGDFAMYRESANFLFEFGRLDSGFVYMPGLVLLLAALQAVGGEIVAAKLMGALFGGLATAPIYFLTARLLDTRAPSHAGASSSADVEPTGSLLGNAPVALTAALLYALWPAGITLASVIGTDVPTAALLLLALAVLHGWGPKRPLLAAIAFGAATGLAAYLRAVALPLTFLSAGYWLVRRAGMRATALRTALAVGVTLLVLSPWAIRNLRVQGAPSFTDSHGGITALMGNYPNTEGTYARSLGLMFKELTGRTFLSEPHRETDRLAYGMAKRWMGFQPQWTAGMIALRLERLFAPERGLLYWSLYRPGVLPRHAADWFGHYRPDITAFVDGFYLFFVGCLGAGVAFALTERRWGLLLPSACAAMLAVTYALFVAEPRYRLTTEILLFPVAGLGLHRLGACAHRAARGLLRRDRARLETGQRRGLVLTAVVLGGLALTATGVVKGGEALRERRRWAATVWQVNGRAQPAFWRRSEAGVSPVHGLADGVTLVLGPGRTEAVAEIVLPDLAPPAVAGDLHATLSWQGEPGVDLRLEIGTMIARAPAPEARGALGPTVGSTTPTRLPVRLVSGTPSDQASGPVSVTVRSVTLNAPTP